MKGRRTVGRLGAALMGGVVALGAAAAGDASVRAFNIPAEEAGKSIPEFARQAGRQIVAPGEWLRGVRTPGVKGSFDIQVALAALLDGTGLSVVSDDGRIIILAAGAENTTAPATDVRNPYETVIVTGYRASLANAINVKRRSVGFSDVVFAEDTGKFRDTNLAEAFNRIPGITISRELDGTGVNVSIRGLDSNFTKVLLNGAPVAVASTGPTNFSNPNREVDLNILPVELFRRLTVDKSARAAQVEGASSGTLDMRNVRAFDNPGFHVSYTLKGVTLTAQNSVSPNGTLIVSDTIGPFGVLVGLTANSTRFFTTGFESAGWTTPNLVTSGPVIQCAPELSCNTLGGGNWTIPVVVPANVTTGGLVPGETLDQTRLRSLNPALSLSQLNNMLLPRLFRPSLEKGVRSRYNGVVSLEHHPSQDLYIYANIVGARITNHFDRADIDWVVRNGAAIPLNVEVDSNGVVAAGTFANAQWFLEDRPYRERGDFVGLDMGLDWQAGALLTISARANASRSHFLRDVPSILVATTISSDAVAGPQGGVTVTYTNRNGITPSIATNIDLNDPASFQWSGGRVNASAEKRYTFTNGLHVDARYGGEELALTAGLAYDGANRAIQGYDNSQAWQNAVCGNNPNIYLPGPNSQPPCLGLNVAGDAAAVNAVAPGYPSYPGLGTGYSAGYPALAYRGSLIPQSSLASYLKPGLTGFVAIDQARFFADSHYAEFAYPNAPAAAITNLGVSSGTIDERNFGVFGEVNGAIDLDGSVLKVNAGLRWAGTLQTVTGPVSQSDPRNGAAYPLDGGKYPTVLTNLTSRRRYGAILPAVNLVLDVAEDVEIRASLSRTMTRPNPSSLLPGINFSDTSASNATVGNGALNPYFSTNIDVGAELYTGGEGYIGFALFRKQVSGFTTTVTTQQPFGFLAQYGISYDTLTPTQKAGIDSRGGPDLANVNVTQVINASGDLVVRGVEFNIVQPLNFLLGRFGLQGFGISGNLTIVEQSARGAVPVVATGISPYTYNVTGYYEDQGVSVRLSYVFNDRQAQSATSQYGICLPNLASQTCPAGAYIYSDPRAQLDLSTSFKLSTIFGALLSDPEAVFDIQNLTKSKLRTYFQYREATFAYYAPGATIIFGVRGTL